MRQLWNGWAPRIKSKWGVFWDWWILQEVGLGIFNDRSLVDEVYPEECAFRVVRWVWSRFTRVEEEVDHDTDLTLQSDSGSFVIFMDIRVKRWTWMCCDARWISRRLWIETTKRSWEKLFDKRFRTDGNCVYFKDVETLFLQEKFEVHSNYKSLRYLFSQKALNIRQRRYMDGVHYRIWVPNYVPPRKGYHKRTKQNINLKGHTSFQFSSNGSRMAKNIKKSRELQWKVCFF